MPSLARGSKKVVGSLRRGKSGTGKFGDLLLDPGGHHQQGDLMRSFLNATGLGNSVGIDPTRGDYDPQLTKVGWVRISSKTLTVDELYMDADGNDSDIYLGGLGVKKSGTSQVGAELASEQPLGRRRKQNLVSSVVSMSNTALSIVEASIQTSTYLVSRFMGEAAPLPQIAMVPTNLDPEVRPKPPWKNAFAVLKHKTLFVYSSDERLECMDILLLPDYKVDLFPETFVDREFYRRDTPIRLRPRSGGLGDNNDGALYLYTLSGTDKEDWYVMLRRTSNLPSYADQGALSMHFQESESQRQYSEAIKKLYATIGKATNPDAQKTAWLNAMVGRAFVAFHGNQKIKDWIIGKINDRVLRPRETSFLGAIVIQDLSVGDSLPVIYNPKLKNFSEDGSIELEFDIDYTGGFQIQAATVATISVAAWEAYLKPLEIPLVVAIKVIRFSARLLIKMKPFSETSRLWVGFYRQNPEMKIELEVEPIISNKLIKLSLVNQVIEKRIKEALDEFIVLPNMEDIGLFWNSDGKGGFFNDDSDDEMEEEEFEDAADGYSEDEQYGYGEDDGSSENLAGLQTKLMNNPSVPDTIVEAVEEDEDERISEQGGDDDEDMEDPDEIIRKTEEKLLLEAMKAREAEALWYRAQYSAEEEELETEEDLQESEDANMTGIEGSDLGDNDEVEQLTMAIVNPESASLAVAGDETQDESNEETRESVSEAEIPETFADEDQPRPTLNIGMAKSQSMGGSSSESKTPTRSVFEFLGETAEYAGRKSREYGLDEMARSLSERAGSYSSTLRRRTSVWSDQALAYFGYAPINRLTSIPDEQPGSKPSSTVRPPSPSLSLSSSSSNQGEQRRMRNHWDVASNGGGIGEFRRKVPPSREVDEELRYGVPMSRGSRPPSATGFNNSDNAFPSSRGGSRPPSGLGYVDENSYMQSSGRPQSYIDTYSEVSSPSQSKPPSLYGDGGYGESYQPRPNRPPSIASFSSIKVGENEEMPAAAKPSPKRTSTLFAMLGVNISTAPPETPTGSASSLQSSSNPRSGSSNRTLTRKVSKRRSANSLSEKYRQSYEFPNSFSSSNTPQGSEEGISEQQNPARLSLTGGHRTLPRRLSQVARDSVSNTSLGSMSDENFNDSVSSFPDNIPAIRYNSINNHNNNNNNNNNDSNEYLNNNSSRNSITGSFRESPGRRSIYEESVTSSYEFPSNDSGSGFRNHSSSGDNTPTAGVGGGGGTPKKRWSWKAKGVNVGGGGSGGGGGDSNRNSGASTRLPSRSNSVHIEPGTWDRS
ncbi:hypothetical protein HDU76_001586 [Blyttiomyces sp. JEL0837]|nr:hypothetical protein HDU76_001586 [Blyttiomyces sp. JEL0837]